MTWLAVIKLLLSIANTIAKFIQEKQLLDAGESIAVAKSMAELSRRLDVVEQVRTEVEAMSDDELDAALRGDD